MSGRRKSRRLRGGGCPSWLESVSPTRVGMSSFFLVIYQQLVNYTFVLSQNRPRQQRKLLESLKQWQILVDDVKF